MLNRKSIIEDITHWIEMHLDEDLTIDIIASRSGYSKWHLQRMFRDVNKISIAAFIRETRLDNAYADLLRSDDKITDIGERNGFTSLQVFSRSFVNRYGISPTTYRNSMRNPIQEKCLT